ncbi:hypothetical protein IHQ56_12905, partial [Methylobacillus flagellatus]|uniref:hypothetical protein n=1 Tax=Methylobacillus flagellatus TaxID=405 RepID=UPI0028538F7B
IPLALIPSSVSISFLYENKQLIIFLISYFILGVWFSCYVIFEKNIDKKSTKNLTSKKWPVFAIFLITPWFISSVLVLLTPLISDFIASEFQIREYRAIRIESYAKSFRNLSKLYVKDIYNNEASFVIKNEMLIGLHLREGDKLIATGRNCVAGFVIDSINGVSRKNI